MKGDNLIFLVTIPIHDGSNEGSLHGKAAEPSVGDGGIRQVYNTANVPSPMSLMTLT